MSLHLASATLVTPIERAGPSALRRALLRLCAPARRLGPVAVFRAIGRMAIRSDRLSPTVLRDLGLSAEQTLPLDDQIRQITIWGPGGVMWRP